MRFQAPKGTRDFFPADCALRNYILDAWRKVSLRHGFEQVDGPIFETLDLYKVKSGEGIISELFHFEDRGERQLAIRPEFTPTLARMVAAQANALPRPIKWFCIPNLCRAEKPQRGRLREFWQWNIDLLGSDSPLSDAECIFTAIDFLQTMGLTPQNVRVKISHRQTVRHILAKLGVQEDQMLAAFDLLDRRDKIDEAEFRKLAGGLGLDEYKVERFEETCRRKYPAGDLEHMKRSIGMNEQLGDLEALDKALSSFGIQRWCEYDLGIVRGLAYYTGMVFEVHETSGAMRAMAGGGRYDQLIQLFDGPATPAVGFGMGDVVLQEVLRDKALLPEHVVAGPDVFVVALSDMAADRLPGLVAELRLKGLHTRFSYKSTRNLGKLLKDADSMRAKQVLILDDKLAQGMVTLKDLAGGQQTEVPVDALVGHLTGS
ncbi:MAG: histidine--tRNA ligase [Phycisphaerales bacterium]|nr:histidine--tRNA ligase [Phycisphaerales bacterium]